MCVVLGSMNMIYEYDIWYMNMIYEYDICYMNMIYEYDIWIWYMNMIYEYDICFMNMNMNMIYMNMIFGICIRHYEYDIWIWYIWIWYMGYVSDTARTRTRYLFLPKCMPIPLGYRDGSYQALIVYILYISGQCRDSWNDYSCTCIPGWTGKDCTQSGLLI